MSSNHIIMATILSCSLLLSRLCSSCMWLWMSHCCFTQHVLNIHQLHSMFWISTKVVTVLFSYHKAGTTWNCCLTTCSVYTIQPCTRAQSHFIQSHIWSGHLCLAVTCHLHFWQNERDLLCATAVRQTKKRVFFNTTIWTHHTLLRTFQVKDLVWNCRSICCTPKIGLLRTKFRLLKCYCRKTLDKT